MEQIYYFSLDQTNFYHSKCRICQKLWRVEIKKNAATQHEQRHPKPMYN